VSDDHHSECHSFDSGVDGAGRGDGSSLTHVMVGVPFAIRVTKDFDGPSNR
ncbi:hypothetical protein HAX54_002857, partial [Datura stramonium]|nr:hypothetical protein [Datura stramonium]